MITEFLRLYGEHTKATSDIQQNKEQIEEELKKFEQQKKDLIEKSDAEFQKRAEDQQARFNTQFQELNSKLGLSVLPEDAINFVPGVKFTYIQ